MSFQLPSLNNDFVIYIPIAYRWNNQKVSCLFHVPTIWVSVGMRIRKTNKALRWKRMVVMEVTIRAANTR